MAKGDSGRSQTAINTQGGLAQNNLNNTVGKVTTDYGGFKNNFDTASATCH